MSNPTTPSTPTGASTAVKVESSPELEIEEMVRRLEFFLGPGHWKPPTAKPAEETTNLADSSSDEDGDSRPDDHDHEHSQTSPTPKKDTKDIMNASWSWPEPGLARGDRSREGAVFCPWKLIKIYTQIYVGKTNAQRAKPFFDNPAIHSHNPWDFYYLYNPGNVKHPRMLFVPTYQFENMLDVVNAKLGTQLTIPTQQKNWEKFNITFGIGNSPVPRFLGRSTRFEEFEALERSVPPYNNEDEITRISIMAQQDYLDLLKLIETSSSSAGTKSKKSEKKRIQRIQDRKSWGMSVKRVQRYLGIRKQASDLAGFEKLSLGDAKASASAITVPVVAKPERGVIFVAIDIEAFEFSQKLITEIGVGVFDTLDIGNRAPGDMGKDWFDLVRGYHFRIKENSWATNSVHVDGNADKFDFGKTEFVEKRRIKKLVTDIVEDPGHLAAGKDNKSQSGRRPVVLVFHDAASDIKFLEALQYDVKEAENVLEIVDTTEMFQQGFKASQPPGLERLLAELNIPSRYLHNAGNDAVYTMQAMIGLAFKLRQKSMERARDWMTKGEKDSEGWATGGDESDGGAPGEKAPTMAYPGMHYLRGAAFQPGAAEASRPRAPSPPRNNVFSWSDNEDELADAEHLRW